MYRHRPDYESDSSLDRYTYERYHSRVPEERVCRYYYVRKETFMERIQRFVNENFFFRIEGVDSDDVSERIVIDSSQHAEDKEHNSLEGKDKDSNASKPSQYAFEHPPEIVVEDPTLASKARIPSPSPEHIQVQASSQPTQLSCLSISIYSAVIIAMVCIFLFIGRDYVKYILFSLEQADFWISLIVFCILFTIVSFPMTWGYILLNIAVGYLYGLILGLVIVISCALTGLFIAHCVIRRCLRNFVLTKFTNKSFISIMNVVDHSTIGFKVVIWARLTPIPFGLQNALFGVCGISTPRYILASFLGMLPTQGMHAYIGSTLRSMEEVISSSSGSSTAYLVFGAQLVIAIGLLCFVIRRARMEFNKMVQDAQPAESAPSTCEQPLNVKTESTNGGLGMMVEKAHNRSASVPGAITMSIHHDRPRTGSFSPKPVCHREHSQ